MLGSMTWGLYNQAPADRDGAIRDAMDWAINHINTIAGYSGFVPVGWNPGLPTAQASFARSIEFGGAIARGVALHELAHWLGTGSAWQWGTLLRDGRFTGSRAIARLRAYDGPEAVVNADNAHFWPYGVNYPDEYVEMQRHVAMVSAMRADMGLGPDGAAAIAGMRRFQNRSSMSVLRTGADAGSPPLEMPNVTGFGQDWRIDYADGFITLTSRQSGLAIDSRNNRGDDAATAMATPAAVASQQWEMMPTDNGWFLLRNRATHSCLDNVGDRRAGAPLRLWGCGAHPNQQWHLIRLPAG